MVMMEEIAGEPAELAPRVAALDIGKASLVCCVRVPHESGPGARRREVRTCGTVTPALGDLRDWLICRGVTRVVMEAASACRKPPCCLPEDDIECWVVSARGVKNVPGRPRTGRLGAVWPCKLAGRGMLGPASVPAGRSGSCGTWPAAAHPGPRTQPAEAAGGEAAGGRPGEALQRDQ
jgi:hypothetical protein